MALRRIFHIDVNSAFLSWSAADHLLMGGTTDYRTIHAAVARPSKDGRGIILAKSESAKKLGVITGEPIWMAKEKCPDLYLVPPDYGLYLKASNAMKQIFFEYSPAVESFSIDECFIDMTGQEKFFGSPLAAAYALKGRIKRELGFTVNVGIGNTKATAKMASGFEKPDRVHTLWNHEIPTKLWPLPIENLFMAGRRTVKKLRKIGINTIGDMACVHPDLIRKLLGKQGILLRNYANGVDDSPVLEGPPEPPKSISQSVTLPFLLENLEDSVPIMLCIADHLADKLRKKAMAASVVSVGIKDHDRIHRGKQCCPPELVLHRRDIYRYAMDLLAELWPEKKKVKYVAIHLGGLTFDYEMENTLFGRDILRDERLEEAVFRIRSRYGDRMIMPARLLGSNAESLFRDFEENDENPLPPRFF